MSNNHDDWDNIDPGIRRELDRQALAMAERFLRQEEAKRGTPMYDAEVVKDIQDNIKALKARNGW